MSPESGPMPGVPVGTGDPKPTAVLQREEKVHPEPDTQGGNPERPRWWQKQEFLWLVIGLLTVMNLCQFAFGAAGKTDTNHLWLEAPLGQEAQVSVVCTKDDPNGTGVLRIRTSQPTNEGNGVPKIQDVEIPVNDCSIPDGIRASTNGNGGRAVILDDQLSIVVKYDADNGVAINVEQPANGDNPRNSDANNPEGNQRELPLQEPTEPTPY